MRINYDKRSFAFEYAGAYDTLPPAPTSGGPVTAETIVEALRRPMGDISFDRLFTGAGAVTVVVPDITRYAGAEIYLPPLIDALADCDVPGEAVTILFATGIHRGHTPEERRKIVGPLPKEVRLVDHDAKGEALAPIPMTLAGETVRVNRAVVECDRLILTGAVGLHYLAGFGGGRKAILPGVASYDDATRFHALSLNPDGAGRHPNIGPAILAGNPMSEAAFEAMRLLRPALAINMVMDRFNRPAACFVGDPESAYPPACDAALRHATVPLDRLYDAVLVSCGGFPKDLNFVQAHKSYDNAARAVKPGGKIFLVAACPDGIGNDTFISYARLGTVAAIDAALRKRFHINGQTAMATLEKSAAFETVLLSTLDDETVRLLGMRKGASPEAFFREVADAFAHGHGLVMAEGGSLTPLPPA